MLAKDLRDLSNDELDRRLADTRQELFNLRFQLATRKLENVRRIRQVRKDLARMLLVVGERKTAAQGSTHKIQS